MLGRAKDDSRTEAEQKTPAQPNVLIRDEGSSVGRSASENVGDGSQQ
jgi:hypothetical protein